MEYELKDSGKREQFTTGSQRDAQEGKGHYELLPFEGIDCLAKHFEKGAKKYKARNWEKGQPLSQYIRSALRHTFKAAAGWDDEDHLTAACWNLLCAVTTRERIKAGRLPESLSDIPKFPEQELGAVKEDTIAAVVETIPPSVSILGPIGDDVGSGYRRVREGEMFLDTDEFWSDLNQQWITTSNGGEKVGHHGFTYRRKIS